jgi:hypothetical protein
MILKVCDEGDTYFQITYVKQTFIEGVLGEGILFFHTLLLSNSFNIRIFQPPYIYLYVFFIQFQYPIFI